MSLTGVVLSQSEVGVESSSKLTYSGIFFMKDVQRNGNEVTWERKW